MLPTPPQPDDAAAAGGGEEEFRVWRSNKQFGDPTKFHNWAGRGAADLILPEIKEDPLAAKVKALEAKVADSEYEIAELNQKIAASENRIAKLEQKRQKSNPGGNLPRL